MKLQYKHLFSFWGVVLGICILACGDTDRPLMGYFGEGSSREKCGYNEARKEDYGDCTADEICIWTPFRNGPAGSGPYVTRCGEDPHEEAFCVEPPSDNAVANAPNEEVCGCDGETYPSYIHAHAMGVSIKAYGPCPAPSGNTCTTDDDCELEVTSAGLTDELCIFDESTSCGSLGGATCVIEPWSCPDMSNPVCGCDGQTYDNDCLAIIQGVSVDHAGACGSTNLTLPPSDGSPAPRDLEAPTITENDLPD